MSRFRAETRQLSLSTGEGFGIEDVTDAVRAALSDTGLADGTVTLFVPGATAGLTTVEYEPGLVADLEEFFERAIPSARDYHHNRRWGDGNGHSHVRASLLGPSLVVPFASGRLTLGTWQQIIFVDFDVPARHRTLVAQFLGLGGDGAAGEGVDARTPRG